MINRDRAADAMGLWRAGERLARRPMAPDWRADYAAAVDGAVAYLRRYGSMPELVNAYFDGPDDWLEPLCRRPGGGVLNYGIVEDAAYWRQSQELVRLAVGE